MSDPATFESFQRALNRLVDTFGRNLVAYKSSAYDEASLRQEFLTPFFRALGWDVENDAGLIPQHREVEIESRPQIGGRQKRADFLFRTHPTDRFVCEAKKPAEELHAGYAFQAKRYAWNKGLPLAVLTDFEEFKIYIVGGRPYKDEPEVGLWETWHYTQYPLIAQQLWDLLARERVAAGSIDQLIDSLPKKPTGKGKGKAKQGWLIKPDRARALDTDFLNFLDEARRELASDLLRHNDRADLLEGAQLNESVQRILDRILFLRICEDRDIDTGYPLDRLVRSWREDGHPDTARTARQQPFELHDEESRSRRKEALTSAPKNEPPDVGTYAGSLWHALVRHFRALDRRPPSHIPFFNGNLFKPHFSEELLVSDEWLAHFLDELGDEESPYLFSYIPVEILGTIYERFLGKVVRPHGRGVTIEEKPEVRKAGGVYYTPRYIVEYIVAQTVGKLLAGRKPEDALKVRILDPACGSGSFLICAFEAVCEHCQQWLTDHLHQSVGDEVTSLKLEGKDQSLLTSAPTAVAWLKKHRDWCWLEPGANAVHLTTKARRRILRETIHGVDLDPQAVEVTQLSLYLKMLENENRTTLAHERSLFGSDEALLPPLQDNIKCGNSLIASDFSMIPENLVRVHAFDWPVQFPAIMKVGGFDAVIGNPPYRSLLLGKKQKSETDDTIEYYQSKYPSAAVYKMNLFGLFMEYSTALLRKGGQFSFIIPNLFFTTHYFRDLRHFMLGTGSFSAVFDLRFKVFDEAEMGGNGIFVFSKLVEAPVMEIRVAESKEHFILPVSRHLPTTSLRSDPDLNLLASMGGGTVMARVRSLPFITIDKACIIYQGIITGDNSVFLSDTQQGAKWQRILRGRDIDRYAKEFGGMFVFYEPKKLWSNTNPEMFKSPEKLISRQTSDRLVATYDNEGYFSLDSTHVIQLKNPLFSIKYLLGIYNSRLLNFLYSEKVQEGGRAFAQVKVVNLKPLPIRLLDLCKPADKAQHDKLVGLVDKMLALTPQLRAAKTDAERETLQNAITATDQQIDALVYELYGLTPAEIALVEGGQ
ncbi:MAG: TaqI-like C-terminal specificity domain-containing protein [Verrucomicrobiota bacterium]